MSGSHHDEPKTYKVGLLRGLRQVEAWVFDLPGCCAVAPTAAAARDLLPVAIAEHIAWLDGHGQVTRVAFPFDTKLVEEVESDAEFCFEADKAPLSTEEMEAAIRQLAYARDDLLRFVRPLPDAVLNWRPPASAFEFDASAPEPRSIRDILGHLAGAEAWHLRNLRHDFDDSSDGPPPDIFTTRERMIERLRSLSDTERDRIYRWAYVGRPYGEWSIRKVLRRSINHERFHTKEIEQRLAWLILGLPEVLPASRDHQER